MPGLDLRPITELDLQPYEEDETILDLRKIEEQARDTLRLADESGSPIKIIEDFYEPIKAEEAALKPLFKEEWKTQGKIGLAEQIRRMDAVDWASRLPFSPLGLLNQAELYSRIRRLKANNYEMEFEQKARNYEMASTLEKEGIRFPASPSVARDNDIKFVENYFLKINEEQARGTTFGAKVFAGATYLPAWMIEFLATGGLNEIGNKAAKDTAEKLLQGYAKTKAGQLILKSAGWTGGFITRATIGMPHRIAAEAIKRQIPKQVAFGPNDELVFDIDPESWEMSIFKGWLNTVIEVASEQSGQGLTVGAKALATKLPFGSKIVAMLSKWEVGGPVGRFFTRAGWSNLLAEWGEERLATGLHGIFDTEDFGTGPDSNMLDRLKAGISRDIQQFPVELAVLSLPSGVRYVGGKVAARIAPVTPVAEGVIPPVSPEVLEGVIPRDIAAAIAIGELGPSGIPRELTITEKQGLITDLQRQANTLRAVGNIEGAEQAERQAEELYREMITPAPEVITPAPAAKIIPGKPKYTIGTETTYEKRAFGMVRPDIFPAHEVKLANYPDKDVVVYKAKGGWIVTDRKTGEIFKKSYKGKIYEGYTTPEEAVENYVKQLPEVLAEYPDLAEQVPTITPEAITPVKPTPERITSQIISRQQSFETYQKMMPDATEPEIVNSMIEDGLRPPAEVLERNEDLPSVQEIRAEDRVKRVAAKARLEAKVPTVPKAPIPPIEPQTESERNQMIFEFAGQEATEASRQYLNQPVQDDLPEGEPTKKDIGFIKNILHNLGIKDKGDYEPLSTNDFREIYKFVQMPFDIGLSFPQFKPIYETQRARELTKLNLDIYFAGKLQPYFQLDKESRNIVNAALCEADRNPAETFGPKRLKEMGLDENQMKAFLSARTAFDESLNILIERMERVGIDKKIIEDFKAKAGNYIPHKWYGNWAVVVRERIGRRKLPPTKREIAEAALERRPIEPRFKEAELKKPRTVFMTRTNYIDRFKERERLQKLYPDNEVIIIKANKIPYQAFQDSAPWAVHRMVDMVIERAQANPEVAADMREALTDLYKSKGFGMHFIKRRNIPGYTEDLQRPIAEYFNGFTGYLTKMQAIQEFSENITAVNPKRTPNLYRYTLDYIKYVTGEQLEFMRAKRAAYAYYLWSNIKSASLNLTQNITLGWPVLTKYTDFALPKILQAMARTVHPAMLTKNEKGFLSNLERAGFLQPQLTQEISAFAGNPLLQGIRTKTGKIISFLDIFRHIESFNRKSMGVALCDSGITNIKKAGEIIEEAHFRYGKGNRPTLARGYISPVMVFRSWGINYFTWVKNEIKAGRIAPETKSVLAIVFLGGFSALPFASLFKWIWRKVFGTDPEADLRNAIGKTAGQLAMRGVPSQIGVSFTGSISPMDIPSPADISTLEKSLTELGGVFADVPARVYRVSKSLEVKNYLRALEDASPEVLRNPLAAYRLYEEGARTRNGRIILDLESGEPLQMTSSEMIKKMLGYQPIRLAEQYDIQKALDQFYSDRIKLKQNWADRYWLSFLDDDKDEMLNITQEIIDYNAKMERRGRENDKIEISEMDDMLTTRARPLNIPAEYMMPKYQEILNKFYQRKFEKTK